MLPMFCCEQTDAPEPLPGFRGFLVVVVVREILKRLADDCSGEEFVATAQFLGTSGTFVAVPSDRMILDDLLPAAMTPEGYKTWLFG